METLTCASTDRENPLTGKIRRILRTSNALQLIKDRRAKPSSFFIALLHGSRPTVAGLPLAVLLRVEIRIITNCFDGFLLADPGLVKTFLGMSQLRRRSLRKGTEPDYTTRSAGCSPALCWSQRYAHIPVHRSFRV